MGLLRKIFSIPEKFGKVFTFYNKHGVVSRIFTLLGAIAFTVATIFLEKWAFGLFADNYIWGLLALIFSFSIGLGGAEFLIMCCITAILSTLKSSVVDTAKFISKKRKDKKEKNNESADQENGSNNVEEDENLAILRAAEEQERKANKDVGIGFKDAVSPNEWQNMTKTLQSEGNENNFENTQAVTTSSAVEFTTQQTQNLTADNQSEITIKIDNEPEVSLQPQVITQPHLENNAKPQVEVVNSEVQPINTTETIQAQPENLNVQTSAVSVESNNIQSEQNIPSQPENIVVKTQTVEAENTPENTQTEITENVPDNTQPEQTVNSEGEETKTDLEVDAEKLESMLQNEKSGGGEESPNLEKKKKSYKILDIFLALIFAFLGFVLVTKYIEIFKVNANELKFWEKIDFSKIWDWIKFW